MQGFFRAAPLVVVLAVLALAPAARPAPPSDFQGIKRGLELAVARDWIDSLDADRYRAIAYRATRAIPRLPGARATNLAYMLRETAALRDWYTAPRALALFSMLEFNTQYLARRPMPPERTDLYDADGVLYRAFAGRGLQFHPLGNFARLGNLTLQRSDQAPVLAQALLDRAVARAGGLLWEYYFPFGGGTAPWTSGMAQAVAASALARVGIPDEARAAFLALYRGLLTFPSAGPWIRLYSFSSALVLNAQLQAAVSVETYARLTGDVEATGLAERLRATAGELMPRCDTGAWSRYALGGAEATLEYHRFVVDLLGRLSQQRPEEPWADWQVRFDGYLHEPPALTPRGIAPAVAGRRPAAVTFWLSKLSRVTLTVAGQASVVWLPRGLHTLTWSSGARRPGAYRASLAARDPAGNVARIALPRLVVRRS